MANPIWNPFIGQLVYRPFKPQNPGKIIEIEEGAKSINPSMKEVKVKVKWIKGEISSWYSYNLNDFDELIKEHEKKLNTHKNAKQKLLSL